jgi:putative sigma-54 modulation protein
MNLIVKSRNASVPTDVREYAEEKVGKVGKILNSFAMEGEVELFSERNPAIENGKIAEVTIRTKGPVIRARASATTYPAAIDLASAKVEAQARKVHGKFITKHKQTAPMDRVAEAPPLPDELEEPEDTGSVVKTKSIDVKPMTFDEAILQLELLGHDFFVFQSAGTEEISVLYRRRDGDYGLIEPRMS